jgi:hypothetical protein
LSRPSSPVRAKASTVRPCSLGRICSLGTLHPTPLGVRRRRPGSCPAHPFPFGPRVGARVHLSTNFLLPTAQYPGFQSKTRGWDECLTRYARLVSLLSAVLLRGAAYSRLQKGGDPAAGSPTATLLRLRPSHRARLRRLPPLRVGSPTSGAPDSHGVTGGVYKARERIHRGVADPRLLAIPASCSRVTDCNPNLDQVFAIRSASRPCCALSWPL